MFGWDFEVDAWSKNLKMKFDEDLCLNLWYELNPRVRCAFGNVFKIKLKRTVFDCPHMDPILRHWTSRGVTYGKYPPPVEFSSASDSLLNSTCLLSEEHNLDQGGLLLNFVASSFVIWSLETLSRWPETLGSFSSLSTSSISSQHFNSLEAVLLRATHFQPPCLFVSFP